MNQIVVGMGEALWDCLFFPEKPEKSTFRFAKSLKRDVFVLLFASAKSKQKGTFLRSFCFCKKNQKAVRGLRPSGLPGNGSKQCIGMLL